jgi:NADH-quinone oxidoreductase subunit N
MADKLLLFLPEAYLLGMTLVMFFFSLSNRQSPARAHVLTLTLAAGLVATAVCALGREGMLFYDAYRVDLFSQLFKVVLSVSLLLVVIVCGELKAVDSRYHPEFYFFLCTCTLGMMMLVSGMELMTIYLSLELSSFSLYILVPLRKGSDLDVEAGIKYLFIGVTASCLMLFGMSYIFGLAGTTYVPELMAKLPKLMAQPAAFMGLLLVLAGFFFKLAVFPFHFWAPDVYQGAANQVTTYIATASKVAAVALLIRITSLTQAGSETLIQVLTALSIASMTLGNLVAIVQKDLKRMLAYSAIAHAGYVLIGVLSMSPSGYSSAVFYTSAYVLMSFAVFMVVVKVAADGQDLKIDDLAGLHQRAPLLALTMMMGLFSLAGIPPTAGFTGKFLVFAAAMEKGDFWLVFIGMVNATVSLYYYLMVIKAAYLQDPPAGQTAIAVSLPDRALNYALIAAMIYLGLAPSQLLALTGAAVKGMFLGG